MDRHIYNQSNQPWTFSVNPNAGNVYFTGDTPFPSNSENGPWTVPAQGTAAMQFTTSDDESVGQFTIMDHLGAYQQFDYGNDGNEAFAHDGDTGPANLNDPVNCDITMGGDQW